MAKEIERKFLVRDKNFLKSLKPGHILQGFISTAKDHVVRVRIHDEQAFLAIKGSGSGISRTEFEYTIPLTDARELLNTFCKENLIEKYRYLIKHHGHQWEVDEFLGENNGLFLAEIELLSEEEQFSKPPWLGEEVTGDKRYYNAFLAGNPFKSW